jgi:hypothetical protein
MPREEGSERGDVRAVDSIMDEWKRAGSRALRSGAAASLLSAVALAALGRIENRSAAGPLNGPSQWIFGRWAAYLRSPSLRHTLTGILIHHLSATGWALLHERLLGRGKVSQTPAQRFGRAAATAAVANLVDFKLTPKRLTPGFEHQLSRKSLLVVYAAFAVGLAVWGASMRERRRKAARVEAF